MKTIKPLLALLICLAVCQACSSSNKMQYKYKNDYSQVGVSEAAKPIIVGPIEWRVWLDNLSWSSIGAKNKSADALLSRAIGKVVESGDYFFLLFAGSWCEDSETQTPIIYKIFENGKIDLKYTQLIGIDKNKADNKGLSEKFNIKKSPTLVILYKNKEIGRIQEFPAKTWEEDILNVLYRNN
jgi:hypothetical protein